MHMCVCISSYCVCMDTCSPYVAHTVCIHRYICIQRLDLYWLCTGCVHGNVCIYIIMYVFVLCSKCICMVIVFILIM